MSREGSHRLTATGRRAGRGGREVPDDVVALLRIKGKGAGRAQAAAMVAKRMEERMSFGEGLEGRDAREIRGMGGEERSTSLDDPFPLGLSTVPQRA